MCESENVLGSGGNDDLREPLNKRFVKGYFYLWGQPLQNCVENGLEKASNNFSRGIKIRSMRADARNQDISWEVQIHN